MSLLLFVVSSCKVKKDFEQAEKINTIYIYEDFLKKYKKTKYNEQAKKNLLELYEKNEWLKAKSYNTIEAYFEFLQFYPTSYYAKVAKEKIYRLEEIRDWKAAKEANRKFDYYNFIKKYPKSRFVEEAKKIAKFSLQDTENIVKKKVDKTDLLIEKYLNIYFKDSSKTFMKSGLIEYPLIETYWQTIKELNYRGGYLDFLYNFPNSIYSKEAITRIREIESDAWDLAKQINSAQAYVQFYNKYSNSEYAQVAMKKIIDFKVDEVFKINYSRMPDFIETIETDTLRINTIDIYNKSKYPITFLASSDTESKKIKFDPYQLKTFMLKNEEYRFAIIGKNIPNFITEIFLRGGNYQMQFEIPK